MSESILTSVKKLIGPEHEETHFDPDIIMHINAAISILTQLGIGPEEGFVIENADATWEDFIDDDKRLSGVKLYVYMKVKLVFDPPVSAATIASMEGQIKEYEWRANEVRENDLIKVKKGEIQNG